MRYWREGLLDEVVPADGLLPPEVFRMTKQALCADAVARMDGAADYDRRAHALWAAPDTHARIREYTEGRSVDRKCVSAPVRE